MRGVLTLNDPADPAFKYRSADRCLSLQLAAIFFAQAAPGSSSCCPGPGSRRAEYPRSPGPVPGGHQSTDESLVSARSTELRRCRLSRAGHVGRLTTATGRRDRDSQASTEAIRAWAC